MCSSHLLLGCGVILAPNLRNVHLRWRQLQVHVLQMSATTSEMARLRNHLWLDGITYQGACLVLVCGELLISTEISNSPQTGQRRSGFSQNAEDRPYRGDTDPGRALSSIASTLGFD